MSIGRADDDLRALALAMRARAEFDYEAAKALEAITAKPPATAVEAFRPWLALLQRQEGVLVTAGMVVDVGHDSPWLTTDGDPASDRWTGELDLKLGAAIRRAVQERRVIRELAPPDLALAEGRAVAVVASPCPGPRTDPPAAVLAVVAADCVSSEILATLDACARNVAMVLALQHAQKAEGFRQMADRVGHMCASSILTAQLRLNGLLRSMGRRRIEDRKQIQAATEELEEAQQGLDRARLLGIAWSKYAEDVPVGPLIAEIGSRLNVAASADRKGGKPIIDQGSLDCCEREPVTVPASRVRLRYAIRDLLVGTSILTNRERPLLVTVMADGRKAHITITGGKLALGLTAVELATALRAPDTFLVADDEHVAERGIGFHLAWHLIEEIGGQLRPELSDGQLTFRASLPTQMVDPS